jgi:hypothetical protein
MLYETVELSMWVWCEAVKGSVGMVWNGRGINGYGLHRTRGQWILYETVEVSVCVWCETAEGSMVMV